MSETSRKQEPFRAWIEREHGRAIGKSLGAASLAVYWALACHRPNVAPSIETLSGHLSLSRAAVKRHLRALKEHGFIERELTPGDCTTYTLKDSNGHPAEVGSTVNPPPAEVGSLVNRESGHQRPGGEVKNASSGGSLVTPEEDNRKKTNKKTTKKPSRDGLELAFFQEWYAAYPRHIAKGAAVNAFSKALAELTKRHDGDQEAALSWLMERTRLFAAARDGQEKRFTPHPSTWLNKERYDDEDEATAEPGLSMPTHRARPAPIPLDPPSRVPAVRFA